MNYRLALSEKDAAYQQYNYAGQLLENKQIRARLAEIEDHHEPLASLLKADMTERARLYAAAFYVVIGRMPEKKGVVEGA